MKWLCHSRFVTVPETLILPLIGIGVGIALVVGCKSSIPLRLADPATSQPARDKIESDAAELELLHRLKLGMSASEVTKLIGGTYTQVDNGKYAPRYPFSKIIPATHKINCSIWESRVIQVGGWPALVFATFSDQSQTNLIDALWVKHGEVRPLLDGVYSMQIRTLAPGDTVQTLFSKLGHRPADYAQGADGRWRVTFEYWDMSGKIIVVEADATDGRILTVRNATI